MTRATIKCRGVQTEVVSEGRWVEEDPLPHSSKHVVLILPGNPGVPLFYETFVKTIHSRLSADAPVWIVGHAGHLQPPENLDIALPGDEKWNEYYSLSAQIQHKAAGGSPQISYLLRLMLLQTEFIKKYVPEDAKLHLIGHSIGAWLVLNLLKNSDIEKRIKRCYLLFPTVEHMAESRNGRFFQNFVSHFTSLWLFLAWIFMMFPLFLQALMIRVFGMFYGVPAKHFKAVQQILHPKVLYRVIRLAKEEMKYVKEADHETISKHADKLWFYYGARDGWVPVKYYKDMISKHPNLNAQLCQRGLKHSFVLRDDIDMGNIVGDLINEECLSDSRH